MDTGREGVPGSGSTRLGMPLGFATGNLLIGASGMPPADSGECVMEPYWKVEAKDFRREWWLSWQSSDFSIPSDLLWLEMGGKLFPPPLLHLPPKEKLSCIQENCQTSF